MRDQLVTPKIGKWGQLQEWMEDKDDSNDHHRHASHLFAVYPGHQISPVTTPELAAAAAKSLEARGLKDDNRHEWVWTWRAALWARLGNAENARARIVDLFRYNTSPNLIGSYPWPNQWDSTFGITAAMTEMLLQSQAGEINLLPAVAPCVADRLCERPACARRIRCRRRVGKRAAPKRHDCQHDRHSLSCALSR